jgi:DnaJ-class molecular chaperone
MIVVVHVIVPSDLSEEQEELARKLGETLEPRNLRRGGQGEGGEESFFSRVRRAFG